jgi:transposase
MARVEVITGRERRRRWTEDQKRAIDQALIAHQRLQIEKLTRQIYGQRSERTVRLLDQIELAFEELESSATEDEIAAARAVARTSSLALMLHPALAGAAAQGGLPQRVTISPPPGSRA